MMGTAASRAALTSRLQGAIAGCNLAAGNPIAFTEPSSEQKPFCISMTSRTVFFLVSSILFPQKKAPASGAFIIN